MAHIVIVEDDLALSALLGEAAELNGHTATVASNAEAALAALEALPQPPQIVLSDVQMNGMGGLELLRRLRADDRYRDVFIILCSGRREDRDAALAAGADHYLDKPYSLPDLFVLFENGNRATNETPPAPKTAMVETIEWNRLVPELSVTDLEASLKFYTQVLGFEVVFTRTAPPFAYLNFEGAQLMLEEIETGGWQTGELSRPFGRGINLQIECADVSALRDKISAAAYPLYRDMKENEYAVGDTTYHVRELLVQDPDGYLLRFAQDLGE